MIKEFPKGKLTCFLSPHYVWTFLLATYFAFKSQNDGKVMYFSSQVQREYILKKMENLNNSFSINENNVEFKCHFVLCSIENIKNSVINDNEIRLLIIDDIEKVYCEKDKVDIIQELLELAKEKNIPILMFSTSNQINNLCLNDLRNVNGEIRNFILIEGNEKEFCLRIRDNMLKLSRIEMGSSNQLFKSAKIVSSLEL